MKFKDSKQMKKEAAAILLRELASDIEKGSARFGSADITIPDSIDVEREYKEKKGRGKLEIEMSWMNKKLEAAEENEGSLSDIKQGMKKTFNQILDAVGDDMVPDSGDVDRFVMLTRRFREIAQGEAYMEELESFNALVKDFSEKVKSGDMKTIKERADLVMAAKKSCHKSHIQK